MTMIDVAVSGILRTCEAARRVELGLRHRRTEAVFQLAFAGNRKRRGNGSGIRRAHPRAALSSEAVRVGASNPTSPTRHIER